MKAPLPLHNRYVRLGLIALGLLFLLVLLLAPATGQSTSGSTYNRAPEGYLGWFDAMTAQGTPVQRWRRPLTDLPAQGQETPQTLVRIYPGLVNAYQAWDSEWVNDWLAAGNTLIALGIEAPVTEAPFTTQQDSAFGPVTVKTRRREDIGVTSDRHLLGDKFGAIVWQEQHEGAGKLYLALTPHLAANAYQNAPGNYAFLADLATQGGGTIWVDEYLHGFKEADVIATEVVNSWGEYLADTPVQVIAVQSVILLALVLLSQNRRLGNLVAVKPPKVDNSQAYIEALAAVLHKAESTPFLVDMITKAERSRLQKALGFNEAEVDEATLQTAWQQQTGQASPTLKPLLQPPRQVTLKTDAILKAWLAQLRQLRQTPLR
ncbi:MAG TPA: DUF4350 domain-containing protein [Candidatus Obscuribacterales bacterium]